MLLRNPVCLCTQKFSLPKYLMLNFHFFSSLKSDTLIRAGRLPNSFLSNRNNNEKYEAIKFEASHNEIKNFIQKVLWNELIVDVCGIVAEPSVIVIFSYKINVIYGKTLLLFQVFNLGRFFNLFCKGLVCWWFDKGKSEKEDLLWCV